MLAEGLDTYQQNLNIRQILAEEDKSNSGWRGIYHSVTNKIANALITQGRLVGALDAYQRSLAIRPILTEQDKSNPCWQRDLSVSYSNLGEVLVAKGNAPGGEEAQARIWPWALRRWRALPQKR
jgi:hypothetical protein